MQVTLSINDGIVTGIELSNSVKSYEVYCDELDPEVLANCTLTELIAQSAQYFESDSI